MLILEEGQHQARSRTANWYRSCWADRPNPRHMADTWFQIEAVASDRKTQARRAFCVIVTAAQILLTELIKQQ